MNYPYIYANYHHHSDWQSKKPKKLLNWFIWVISFLVTFIIVWLIFVVFCSADEVKINYHALAKIESNHNPYAVSPKGCQGLYQISPICLKEYNQLNKTNYTPEDLFNPLINFKIAKWYLEVRIPQMLKYYKIPDSIENRLWAYNAGIMSVKGGIMPKETRNYIAKYKKEVGNEL